MRVWYKPDCVFPDNNRTMNRMGVMEVAELKTAIGALEARVGEIRDWL